MPGVNAGWVRGWGRGSGGGEVSGPCFSLQSLPLSQNLATDPDLSPIPLLSPNVLRSPIPRPLPGLKNWDSQATNTRQDRLPLYSKKGHFYYGSFLAYSSDVRFVMSHLEQRWPPCTH